MRAASWTTILALLTAAALQAALGAQSSSATMPIGYDTKEGNASTYLGSPLGPRSLIGIGPLAGVRLLRQLALRRDGSVPSAAPQNIDAKITLSIGDVRALRGDSAHLHGMRRVIVFDQKNVRTPDWSTARQAPAPFDLVFKFSQPYLYSSGDLIWQLEIRGLQRWMVADQVFRPASRSWGSSLGPGCGRFTLTAVSLVNCGASWGSRAMHLGMTIWGTQPQAHTWLLLDAVPRSQVVPGLCSRLYAFPTIIMPFHRSSSNGRVAPVSTGVPYASSIEGRLVVAQLLALDTREPTGISLSNGYRIRMPRRALYDPPRVASWVAQPSQPFPPVAFGQGIIAEFR